MGQRSNTETIVAILKAFLDQRTWKQADLARLVGVQPATIDALRMFHGVGRRGQQAGQRGRAGDDRSDGAVT